MYKLIIVDDEQKIRQGMEKGIPWKGWGFEVIAACADGLEAMEAIAHEKPDVVLSDIRMPRMDGVELMEYLNKNYPEIKIIILSGYSDFEYLNMSIKSNVSEYLLKPTDVDAFEEAFARLKEKLDSEQELARKNEKSRSFYIDAMMGMLMRGYISEESCDLDLNMLAEAGIVTENCAAVSMFEECEKAGSGHHERHEIKVRICALLNSEMAKGIYTGRFFVDNGGALAGIISRKNGVFDPAESVSYLRAAIKKAQKETNTRIFACIGTVCSDSRMLPQSFEQTVSSLHRTVFTDDEPVTLYRTIAETSPDYISVTFDYDKIVKAIVQNDPECVRAEISKTLDYFSSHQVNDYEYIGQLCLELLIYLARWSLQYNVSFEQVMEDSGIRYSDIRNMVSLSGRKNAVLKVAEALCECIALSVRQSAKATSYAKIIKECVDNEYLENHMSLEYVAGKVGRSAAYVSKLFKDEFGSNFLEYITKKRLEKSKELLEKTDMTIYEITERAGYADVSNFIKVFKRRYGITPGDYRMFAGAKQ